MRIEPSEYIKLVDRFGHYGAEEAMRWWSKQTPEFQCSIDWNRQARLCGEHKAEWLTGAISQSHAIIMADNRTFILETFGQININLDDPLWCHCKAVRDYGCKYIADSLVGLHVGEHFKFDFDSPYMKDEYKVTRVK